MRLPAVVNRQLRRIKGLPRYGVEVSRDYLLLGSDYAGYAVCPEGLTKDSVVYSFGVGEDVTFDVALMERFGVTVHAFDPTPRSIQWVEAQALPPTFQLHPWGLAGHDGTAEFAPPENPEHISHTLLERSKSSGPKVTVPVYRLETILEKLGHDHVDVLKVDIEGAEYDVIDSLADVGALIGQILIEFHHQLEGVPMMHTERAMERLHDIGFRCFHESPSGHEFSFIRE